MSTTPTPEQVAEAQAVIDAANAAATKERNDAIRAALAPLLETGLGTDQPLTVSVAELSALIREKATAVAQWDSSASNLMFSLSGPLMTLNGAISRLWPGDEEPEPAPAPSEE